MSRSGWWKIAALAVIIVAYLLGEGDLDISPGPHAWVFLVIIFVVVFVAQLQRHRGPGSK